MTKLPEALRRRIDAYLLDDPSESDRSALEALVEEADLATLSAAFAEPIAFGTAGLRAEVGPGPSRMNLRNVLRASRALLETLEAELPAAHGRGIVVGYDARPSSAGFAEAVCCMAAERGFVVHAFAEAVPTPLVAFAASRLRAAAAVVVTASHNPPADNGMKVYGPAASQIIPPWDAWVAARMHDSRPTPEEPSRKSLSAEALARIHPVDAGMAAEHRHRCLALAARPVERAEVHVAYTALHGVGEVHVRRALAELGHVRLDSVAEQAAPDGRFPTTRKPNPEEPEALERVLALAAKTGASLVLATDPDADRLAVAVRHADTYVVLHGDEIGVLLGEHLARTADCEKPLVLNTIVSSPWLREVATDLGVRSEVTLTGHKWISARAAELESEGFTFVFGYEEAIGFAFDTGVRDKDGIAAAVVLARIATELAAEKASLLARLERIARAHGMHRSRLASTRFYGPDASTRMDRLLDALRTEPPSSLGGREVLCTIDGRTSTIRSRDGHESPLGLPRSSLLGFELSDGVRVLLRPSGTEPKLKLYLDLATPLAEGETYLAARTRGDEALARMAVAIDAWLASAAG